MREDVSISCTGSVSIDIEVLYHIANFWTYGLPEGYVYRHEQYKQEKSLYNLANWLSSGTYGVAHGAIFPEEPLSFDHFANSLGAAILCYPGMKKIALPGVDYLHVGNNIQTPSSYPTKTGYLDVPANKNGVLNIGAGKKPVKGAYNIDLKPGAKGVHYGDATDLKNIASGSQAKIIIENPYGFDPLNSEILRVLQPDGVIEITGSGANKFFNSIPAKAEGLGFAITEVKVPNIGQFTDSSGIVISSEKTSMFTKYILTLNE